MLVLVPPAGSSATPHPRPPSPPCLFTAEIIYCVSVRLIVVCFRSRFWPRPLLLPQSCGPAAITREDIMTRSIGHRPPTLCHQAAVQRYQRPPPLRAFDTRWSVVSHHSILFRTMGGKKLKMPPSWEINFPDANDDADCHHLPTILETSWGRHCRCRWWPES